MFAGLRVYAGAALQLCVLSVEPWLASKVAAVSKTILAVQIFNF